MIDHLIQGQGSIHASNIQEKHLPLLTTTRFSPTLPQAMGFAFPTLWLEKSRGFLGLMTPLKFRQGASDEFHGTFTRSLERH
jgi:hypothetical protein